MDPVVLYNFLVDVRHVIFEAIQAAHDNRPTLRDRFAMAAIDGLLAAGCPVHDAAIMAYERADEMLSARETKPEGW